MKKFLLTATSALLVFILAPLTSCGNADNGKNASDKKTETSKKADGNLPNYRYVDLDSVLSKYNLAKDYNEEMLRMQNNMENEVKRHENSIQSFANTMQNKMQNNGYLSEASYKQDQQKIAGMQQTAQKTVANLQNNYQNAAMQAQKTVNDSIEAFIKEYNAKRGYDAIFFKAATLYINPALDITQEVIEGLNARYNKVKK